MPTPLTKREMALLQHNITLGDREGVHDSVSVSEFLGKVEVIAVARIGRERVTGSTWLSLTPDEAEDLIALLAQAVSAAHAKKEHEHD